MKKSGATKSKAGLIMSIIGVLIILVVASEVILLAWAFLKSLQTQESFIFSGFDYAAVPIKFSDMTLMNYVDVFSLVKAPKGGGRDAYLFEMLGNSIIYAGGCAFVHTLIPCLMGYLVSRYKVWFNKVVVFIIYFTMMFQVYGSMPAMILMMTNLKLINTWIGVFIQKATFVGGGFLFFFATFNAQPRDYAEAATIDGASHFQVMLQIAFPIARVIILIQFVQAFITFWNDYQTPMIYLASRPVAAYGAFLFRSATDAQHDFPHAKLAGFLLILLPIFVLFMFMRKYLLGDVTAGGVKE